MSGLRPGPAADRDLAAVAPVIAEVRRRRPMVHCITAAVSMDIVANGLLAAGARPMMTETAQEGPAVTAQADVLLVNLGTLSTDAMTGIPATLDACRAAGHRWVLDPAAIGAAPVRTRMARDLLVREPAVVRGNASEILALAGGRGGHGPDSAASSEQALTAAMQVAGQTGGVVAVSGARDLIVPAGALALSAPLESPVPLDAPAPPDASAPAWRVARGTPLLTRVTGTGCLLGGLTAACLSAGRAPMAALAATVWMDLAGELAARRTGRPGSFKPALLDALDELGDAAGRIVGQGRPEASSEACETIDGNGDEEGA